jgi:hypothetical protein
VVRYTFVHGAPMLAAFHEDALHDEAVRAFAQRVSLGIYQEYADVLEDSPAKVTVTLNDGARSIERNIMQSDRSRCRCRRSRSRQSSTSAP